MKTFAQFIILSICSFALLNCGASDPKSEISQSSQLPGSGSNSTGFYGACDYTSSTIKDNQRCREWTGDGFAGFDLQVSCEYESLPGGPGVYADLHCTTENLIGICVLDEGESIEFNYYYYGDILTLGDAHANCEDAATTDIGGQIDSKFYAQ